MTMEEVKKTLETARQQTSASSLTSESLDSFGLGGIDCRICSNTGYVTRSENGMLFTKECECMNRRRSAKYLRNSGMSDIAERYTFENYQTPSDKHRAIKSRAERFSAEDSGWFYIGGHSGSGKTHICTAICNRLMERGARTKYIIWRDFVRSLKSMANDSGYGDKLSKAITVPVLYIDDLFKGKVTEADVGIAFELINSRYNHSNSRTIISSELTIDQLCEIDEAIGGRIKERSRGYQGTAPDENWRLK